MYCNSEPVLQTFLLTEYYPTQALDNMIARWGAGLEYLFLEAVNCGVKRAIGNHCSSLRHFKVDSMWKAPGRNLEHLEIKVIAPQGLELGNICTECPNISRLSIDTKGKVGGIVDVCKFYGQQLLCLKLSQEAIDVEALPRITAACSNVRVEFFEGKKIGVSTEWVIALGRCAPS